MGEYWEAKSEEWRDALKHTRTRVWLATGVLAAAGTIYAAAWFGGNNAIRGRTAALTPEERARAEALRGEIAELEKRIAGAPAGASDRKRAAALEAASAKARELARLDPRVAAGQNARLVRLEQAHDNALAHEAQAVLVPLLEQLAGQLEAEHPDATEKLREALKLQRRINESAVEPALKSMTREALLARAVAAAETEPLRRRTEVAMARAQAAMAGRRADEALAAFTEARTAQLQINHDHANSPYADLSAIDRIEAEIATLRAARLAAEVEAAEAAGDTAEAAGSMTDAAANFARATERQREINGSFAQSRFASDDRERDLTIKRQTVLSVAPLAAAAELDRAATRLLRRGETAPALEKISAAAALVDQVERDFPASRRRDPALRAKLAYLRLRGAETAALQGQALEAVRPLPGGGGAQMAATETTQEFYARVMNQNPSRQPGRALPVESVSWHDARDFCARLGWMLGARVRLPHAEEFQAALGAGEAPVWSAETAGGRSHEVGKFAPNAQGFFDLRGNVAEWLEAAAEDGAVTAPLAGGSYLDPAESKRGPAADRAEKTERARQIGFRFVIEAAAR